jgi:hypothetical protein
VLGQATTGLRVGSAEWKRAIEERLEREEACQVIQLPLWPEPKRGTPNSFLRSALFAATKGTRRHMQEVTLASLNGITVKYTGQQLTQSDLDVWETLVHLARSQPLGQECVFTAHGILKKLGRCTGLKDHKWLHSAIIRLTACAVEITHDQRTYFGPLVEGGAKDERTRFYRVKLNRNLIRLFGDNHWTQLDWAQRQAMREKPLAQALHAFWSTHASPLPIKVATLHGLTGSNIKQLRDFKIKLKAALSCLVDVGFLSEFSFEPARDVGDIVRVRRVPRPLPSPLPRS